MQVAVTEFERRVARFHPELVGFLARRLPGDCEEAAQEVWLKMHRVRPDCPDDAAFRAYMYTVARRLVVDLHRRRRARIQLVPMEADAVERRATGGESSPDGRLDAQEVLAVVEKELRSMKPEMAQVFHWRTRDDVPFKEIARRQGVSINTALGRMHRAVKKLAAALEAAGLTGGAA